MSCCIPSQSEYPPPKEGEPPLHRAARVGDHAEIRRLVAAGERLDSTFSVEPDPESREREATPLMVAAGSSDGASVETIRVLLELGADPTTVIDARSAATFACEGLSGWYKPGGDAPRLEALLAAGCSLPPNPERANEVLCTAAASGDAAKLGVLLKHGLNARGYFDPERARKRHIAVMKCVERSRVAKPSPIFSEEREKDMIQRMDQEMLEQALSGPTSDEIPLFQAAASGNIECVKLLLDAGADLKARDNSKQTALYCANSVAVINMLLAAGLSLEDADEYDWSPLADAIHGGRYELPRVQALIEVGANVNETDEHGYTLFMSAVGTGRYPELLRTLIAAGADPHAITEYGGNAFHAAIDVVFGANAEASVRDTLGYLKELGVNIEQRGAGEDTPLARAIKSGSGREVRVLCELGADPNAVCPKPIQVGPETWVPMDHPLIFHAACGPWAPNDVKTEALLKAGADPLAQDHEGFTPLVRAVARLCEDTEEYQAAFDEFYRGLRELRPASASIPEDREAFLAEAVPVFRAYVERFASNIPIPEYCQFDERWRAEKVNCIVLLCAYTSWARLQRAVMGVREQAAANGDKGV